jgi:FAD/FMN-containing dehydrogenase
MAASFTTTPNDIAKLLRARLGEQVLVPESSDLSRYLGDSCKQFSGAPACVVCPANIEQVGELLRLCTENKIPVVPSGGRTGYSGGATATRGEVLLSLERLNKIISLSERERILRVQAGVTLEKVQEAARHAGLMYPVDFTARGSAHIGGTIATNAGGVRVVRYGSTREWVRGLTVVRASGEVISFSGRLIKDNTGYDFCRLFVGSEGTLGVIVEADLALTLSPKPSVLFLAAVSDFKSPVAVLETLSNNFCVSLFEYFDRASLELVVKHRGLRDPFSSPFPAYLLVELECSEKQRAEELEPLLERLVGQNELRELVIAESSEHRRGLMGLRELIGDVTNSFYVAHKNDVSVPVPDVGSFVSRLQEMRGREFPSEQVAIFGHVGDGNLHVNILKPTHEEAASFFSRMEEFDLRLFALVKEFSGSISAEHGVGLLKKRFLPYSRSSAEIQLMREVKKAFDPLGILNPGKVFD